MRRFAHRNGYLQKDRVFFTKNQVKRNRIEPIHFAFALIWDPVGEIVFPTFPSSPASARDGAALASIFPFPTSI